MSKAKIKKIDPSQIKYTPKEGEVIQTPNEEYLIYKDGQWNKLNVESSNLELNLYDINKQIIGQLPELTEKQLVDKSFLIDSFFHATENEYYMLYGKEISYFTLFKINEPKYFYAEVISCLSNIGKIKAIDLTENKDALEIWIEDEEPTCLYLFPYDSGLVKVGE